MSCAKNLFDHNTPNSALNLLTRYRSFVVLKMELFRFIGEVVGFKKLRASKVTIYGSLSLF